MPSLEFLKDLTMSPVASYVLGVMLLLTPTAVLGTSYSSLFVPLVVNLSIMYMFIATDIPYRKDEDNEEDDSDTDYGYDSKEEDGSSHMERIKQLLKEGYSSIPASPPLPPYPVHPHLHRQIDFDAVD